MTGARTEVRNRALVLVRRRARGSVLPAMCAGTVLVVGFVASINLAIPALAASSLHPSATQLLWIVDAYVVMFACLVIPAGAIGDRYGRKRVLIAGLMLFACGAVTSGAANIDLAMLVGRVISGVGAAAVLPNSLAVLIDATEPPDRPRSIAVWAAMSGLGGIVGNVGGGALLQIADWRWLFIAVAPLALLCAAWAGWVVPPSSTHDRPINVGASLLLTLGTVSVLAAIVEGPHRGWSSPVVIAAAAGAVILIVSWIVVESRSRHPMLDPRLFAIGGVRAACLGMMLVFFAMFGFFYLNASLLQYGRGFSVLQTGLAIVPMTVPLLVAARFVPRLVARTGPVLVLSISFLTVAGGLFGAAGAIDQPYVVYAAWLVVLGTGVTLALPTLTIAIAGALPVARSGVAGGLQATTRELGSAVGVAVIGTLLAGGGRGGATTYTSSAADALQVTGLATLVVGAIIVVEMAWSTRRANTGRRTP